MLTYLSLKETVHGFQRCENSVSEVWNLFKVIPRKWHCQSLQSWLTKQQVLSLFCCAVLTPIYYATLSSSFFLCLIFIFISKNLGLPFSISPILCQKQWLLLFNNGAGCNSFPLDLQVCMFLPFLHYSEK